MFSLFYLLLFTVTYQLCYYSSEAYSRNMALDFSRSLILAKFSENKVPSKMSKKKTERKRGARPPHPLNPPMTTRSIVTWMEC